MISRLPPGHNRWGAVPQARSPAGCRPARPAQVVVWSNAGGTVHPV